MRIYHEEVEGAPFPFGAKVRVVKIIDDTGSQDDIGKEGVIGAFEYKGKVGERYPDDPCIYIDEIPDTFFWKEELELVEEDDDG